MRVHNEMPGIIVPEHVQDALRARRGGATASGMARARARVGARLAAGVYVVAPYKRPSRVLELIA